MEHATDFTLPDQRGTKHTLSEYRGKWVVLYFYPKDDTSGCTTEACSFRDSLTELQKQDVVVLGVSKDSVDSHRKFADKYSLNFTILSDESGDVVKTYHAWGTKKFAGKSYEGILRTTYLIDPEGNIRKTYEDVNPTKHAEQILSDLKTLAN